MPSEDAKAHSLLESYSVYVVVFMVKTEGAARIDGAEARSEERQQNE